MATPYLSQISLLAFGFPPKGWALCNGQLLPISQNQALFSLLGTQYGGNGQTTFALPDLRGRTPTHRSEAGTQGTPYGVEAVSLNASQLPQHGHALRASGSLANANLPANTLPASKPRGGVSIYAAPGGANAVPMSPASVSSRGSNQPHENMPPFLAMNFVIALVGVFPSRN